MTGLEETSDADADASTPLGPDVVVVGAGIAGLYRLRRLPGPHA